MKRSSIRACAGVWWGSVRVTTAVLLVPVSLAAAQEAPRVTAFVDVTVVPMDTERVLPHHTVVVEDGHITALGPREQVPVPAGAERIDGRGRFLLPGLADMHTHLAYGAPCPSCAASAERYLFLLLANGVTTIRNMDWGPPSWISAPLPYWLDTAVLLQLKARTATGQLLGPRIYTSGQWRTDTTKSVDENVAAYKAAGYDHLKLYLEYPDTALVDSLVRAAHRLGMPLVGHGYEGVDGIARTLRLGLQSIEHLMPYVSPGLEDSMVAAAMAATARAKVWNSPTTGIDGFYNRSIRPAPLERRYGPAEFALEQGRPIDSVWTAAMVDTVVAPYDSVAVAPFSRLVRGLRDAGPGLLLGTDGPPIGPAGLVIHRALAMFVRHGLTPYEALLTGTRNPAAYFDTDDSTGTIAIGKRADLVLLTGNPLVDIRQTGAIAGVMRGGQWLDRAEIEQRLDAYYGFTAPPTPD